MQEDRPKLIQQEDVTPLSLWTIQAWEIIKPIIQESDITDRYLDVEKEAMPKILEAVDSLVIHLRTIPKS